MKKKFTATSPDRLDKFISLKTGITRSRVVEAILHKKVQIDGQIIHKPSQKLKQGQSVSVELEEAVPKQMHDNLEIQIPILLDTKDFMTVNKPAGLSVHPGAGHTAISLSEIMLLRYPFLSGVGDPARPGIVHRLDKDTSGCLAIAKTKQGYEFLRLQFLERKVTKIYLAVVLGRIDKGFSIDTPLGKSVSDFRKMTTANFKSKKEALTQVDPIEVLKIPSREYQGVKVDEITLILVKLHTGRTHQIRVHMASVGHPVLGDTLYGTRRAKFASLHRQFLHAYKLCFEREDGVTLCAEAPLPEDLKDFLLKLGSKKLKTL